MNEDKCMINKKKPGLINSDTVGSHIICSVYTGILFSKNCFKVTKFDKIYFFVL